MKEFLVILAIIALIMFSFTIVSVQQTSDNEDIMVWAKENNFVVKDIERCLIATGPYWLVTKTDRVYKVEIKGKSPYWFRYNIFGREIRN